MADHTERDYLNVHQVAEILGVHVQTVYRWRRQGKIPYGTTPGGSFRFYQDNIEKRCVELGIKIKSETGKE